MEQEQMVAMEVEVPLERHEACFGDVDFLSEDVQPCQLLYPFFVEFESFVA